MIPKFPIFTPLSVVHKEHIEKHNSKLLPYSDFNFASLIGWSTKNTLISELNGNLVIRFNDYITNEPFYTFIGVNKVNETITTLLDQSVKNKLHPQLKLIPESIIKANPEVIDNFEIQEDRDNFDYVYLIKQATHFRGKKFRAKRNFINRFKKLYKSSSKVIDLSNSIIQNEILTLFSLWQKQKDMSNSEVENELTAIKKIISLSDDLKMFCVGVYIKGELKAFSINDILADGYVINLFEKADTEYQGIYAYLRHITAIYLSEAGGTFLSHEQDLGLEGLRKSKMSYHPHLFFKKYTIKHKASS